MIVSLNLYAFTLFDHSCTLSSLLYILSSISFSVHLLYAPDRLSILLAVYILVSSLIYSLFMLFLSSAS